MRFESSSGFVRMMLSAYMDFRPDRTASANNDNPEETVAAGVEEGGLRLRSLFSYKQINIQESKVQLW